MKSYLLTGAFWAGTVERAVKATAYTLTSVLLVAGDPGLDLLHIGWQKALGVAGGAALLSVLGSIVSGTLAGPAGSPSLVDDRPATNAAPGRPVL